MSSTSTTQSNVKISQLNPLPLRDINSAYIAIPISKENDDKTWSSYRISSEHLSKLIDNNTTLTTLSSTLNTVSNTANNAETVAYSSGELASSAYAYAENAYAKANKAYTYAQNAESSAYNANESLTYISKSLANLFPFQLILIENSLL